MFPSVPYIEDVPQCGLLQSCTGKGLHSLDIRLADKVHGLAIQADARRLFATVESDNTLSVVDTATDKVITTIKLPLPTFTQNPPARVCERYA